MSSKNENDLLFSASGGVELLEEIQELWQQLNAHHIAKSPHFGFMYEKKTWTERRNQLLQQGQQGLHIELYLNLAGLVVAYCVSTVNEDQVGEIDSLFVTQDYRGKGIADSLMQLSMAWLTEKNVKRTRLVVAAGNEEVLGFYARYGFYPAKSILEQM